MPRSRGPAAALAAPATALAVLWAAQAAAGLYDWTWIGGSSAFRQTGVYGTQGVPDPPNVPGARCIASSWQTGDGTLWVFGGSGWDSVGGYGNLNDLWRYDAATGMWTWVEGSSIAKQAGVYGTQGVPNPANTPGARYGASTWTDAAGLLYLFGGWGHVPPGSLGILNDLWRYDPTTGDWTWLKGSSSTNRPGTYGTQGAPDPANTPGSRDGASAWVDASGGLYLFGGSGYDAAGSRCHLNDLWRYDPATGNWTWVKGSKWADQAGVYGTQGSPDPANTPGARRYQCSWMHPDGTVYLFGGWGFDVLRASGDLNDLWRFDCATTDWTWIRGSDRVDQTGVYGTQGVPDPANLPGGRSNSSVWVDAQGTLFLFGGNCDVSGQWPVLNDVWRFDPSSGVWTWIKGSSGYFQAGIYGTKGVPSPSNTPGARLGGSGWVDPSGELCLFGGQCRDAGGARVEINDMWRFGMPPIIRPLTADAGENLQIASSQQAV